MRHHAQHNTELELPPNGDYPKKKYTIENPKTIKMISIIY